MSLFATKKIIELRIPNGKPGRNGGQALQDYVKNSHADVLTIITLPKLDWQTQKAVWVNALKEHAVFIEIPIITHAHLPQWIRERLRLQQQTVTDEALSFIANHVEGNLLAAYQEIQKLALLYPAGLLGLEQVQQVILNTARYNVFQLSEALLQNDASRWVRILEGLQGEGAPLPLIIWLVSEDIRTLFYLKSGLENGQALSALLRQYRVFGDRQKWFTQACQRLSLNRLERCWQQMAKIDKSVKGLTGVDIPLDSWEALLQLGIVLMAPTLAKAHTPTHY